MGNIIRYGIHQICVLALSGLENSPKFQEAFIIWFEFNDFSLVDDQDTYMEMLNIDC